MSDTEQSVPDVEELSIELEPHDDGWYQSMLLECITATGKADEMEKRRLRGRLFVLRDLFGLTEDEVVEIASRYGRGDEVTELWGITP